MKRILFIFFLCLFFVDVKTQTNPGDTIVVQAFTFGSPQNAWFVFPSDTMQYEKVIMKYKLKCNPAQNPACGEWDYLTNTYVYDHTGLLDSSLIVQAGVSVNNTFPDSVCYSNTPTYVYDTLWQYYVVHTSQTSLTNSVIGIGNTSSTNPFSASNSVSRSQYLWKASELTGAGMVAGPISGLQFFLQALGGQMRNLTIRIQATSLDSLTNATFAGLGFTNVYSQNTQFSNLGWNSLQLTTPFNWNGTSNLLIEITYDNLQSSIDNLIAADTTTAFKSGLIQSGNDRAVSAIPGGHIDLPLNSMVAAIDSFITVAYWAFGDTLLQPQNGTCFEANDSIGQRVLNAHMPWSDSQVYWDAGNVGGSYDRINLISTTNQMQGQWNYWAFTKNVATGSMKVYCNGNLFHSGTGLVRRMRNIKTFRLEQGHWGGSNSYAGRMDEFTVFNKELSQLEIQSYMNQAIIPTDPNFNNLALYYSFDDGNNVTCIDSSLGNHGPAILASVQNELKPSFELITNFIETKIRPQITFEQGIYVSYIDSMQVLDSILSVPFQIIVFNDSIINPGIATDTILGWPVATYAMADSTIYQSQYGWYTIFPEVNRYELARYITPYGNGLSLGNGWTWTFDVSDYVTLLHDSVHLAAGNWQELLDVKFLMVLGTPSRDVLDIQNLYNGNFNYGSTGDPIESHLPPLTINIPSNAVNSRWKSRVTGHGMDTPENCAEFCPKNQFYFVNNTLQYTKLVWRDNCDYNPLYPQGGTWVYDRANWCPGAEVWTYDFELTPFVTPGNPAVLNHDCTPYTHTGGWDYYQIEDQVVYYGAPNFTLDASLEDILSPSTNQMWLRNNPVCTNPIIKIKNNGSTILTSLTINYGLNGGPQSVYNWTGNLSFLDTATIFLGNFAWVTGATDFNVTISNPNGGTDQYVHNNSITNKFTYPQVMPSMMVIELKTNNRPWENSYTLKNSAGAVVHSRANMSANTTYKDTLLMPFDCYEFRMTDVGEDGLTWWANTTQGSGYLRFRNVSPSTVIKTFNADFGGEVYQQFTVGLTNSTNDFILTNQLELNVYPNPSDGHVFIDINLLKRDDGLVQIYDVLGNKVYAYEFKSLTAESLEADLSFLSRGIYFVTLLTGDQSLTKKIIIN